MNSEDVVALLEALASGNGADVAAEKAAANAGLPPAAQTRVVAAAQQVAGQLAHDRRRSRELSALFTSARELTELADLEALGPRLVERARDLLGTDFAYLSAFDPSTGELRVRSTAGVVSERFKHLLVPPGTGIAAKVASTGTPQWSSRYDTADVPHASHIDRAVAEEGVRSLLGVPMTARGEVLGVLFAGNRTEQHFSPDGIALLSAFADHAAVVLAGARMLDATRKAAAAAEASAARADAQVAAMERASACHRQLTAAVLRGADTDEVISQLSRWIGRRVRAVNNAWDVTADSAGDAAPSAGRWHAHVRDAVAESRQSGHCVRVPGEPDEVAIAVAVVAGETRLGALLVSAPGTAGPAEAPAVPAGLPSASLDQRTIERAAQVIALLTFQQRAVAHAEERVRGELAADLLTGADTDPEMLQHRARSRGVVLDALQVVCVARVVSDRRAAAALIAADQVGTSGLATRLGDDIVLLAPSQDAPAVAAGVHDALRRAGIESLCAAAPAVADHRRVPAQFAQARDTVAVLAALGLTDYADTTEPFGVYAGLFGANPAAAEGFITAVLEPVIAWDTDHRSDLVATVAAWIAEGQSATRAATRLHVHANTVLQRLNRVDALLGSEWRTPEAMFRVGVAARLHELRRALGVQ